MTKNNPIDSSYHILVEILLALSYCRDIPANRIERIDYLLTEFRKKYLDKSTQK
jgi:hypothetical protein